MVGYQDKGKVAVLFVTLRYDASLMFRSFLDRNL